MESNKKEFVNHPAHYNTGLMETIDVIDQMDLNFDIGDAVKYISRADSKGKKIEDLSKAYWYLNHELEKIKQLPDNSTAIIQSLKISPGLSDVLKNIFDYSYRRNRIGYLYVSVRILKQELVSLGLTEESIQKLIAKK